MSSTYGGSDEFDDEITIPSDGDGPHIKAADVDPAFESLRDAVTYLRRRQMIAPLNWRNIGSNTFNLQRGAFSVKEQSWYGLGDDPGTDQFERSQDSGISWSDLSSALGSSLTISDLAIRPTGDILIVAKGTKTLYSGIYAGYGTLDNPANWTHTGNKLTGTPSSVRIEWDDTASLWCALYRVGASGFKADTLTAPLVVVAGTLPAAWTAYTGGNDAEIGVKTGGGLLVGCFIDDTGGIHTVRVAYSADGGGTWTASSFITTMTVPTIISRPVYNVERDEWYIMVSRASAAEVWRSTNGAVTWIKVGSFAPAAQAASMACADDRLVIILKDGEELYSIDRGVTWKLGNRSPQTSTTNAVQSGGGGFMYWNNIDKISYATLRQGDVGQEIT